MKKIWTSLLIIILVYENFLKYFFLGVVKVKVFYSLDSSSCSSHTFTIITQLIIGNMAAIQETKLRSGTATPRIQWYKTIWADKPREVIGGGLLIYIRDPIIFQRGSTLSINGTEVSTIHVRLSKRQWIEVINLYTPPPNSIGHAIELSVDQVPHCYRCIITGTSMPIPCCGTHATTRPKCGECGRSYQLYPDQQTDSWYEQQGWCDKYKVKFCVMVVIVRNTFCFRRWNPNS